MVGIKDFDMPSCCNSCGHWSFNRDDEPLCDLTYEYIKQFDKRQDDCPLIETIPKADYENRLKADMVAKLTDIQSEFKEGLRCKGCCNNCVNACEDIPAGWFLDFIDAKINSLKENTDGATNN